MRLYNHIGETAWLRTAGYLAVAGFTALFALAAQLPTASAQDATTTPVAWGGLVEVARLPIHFVGSASVGDGYAYLSRHDEGMAVVDIRIPTAPAVRSKTPFKLDRDVTPGTSTIYPAIIDRIAVDVRDPHRVFVPALDWVLDGGLIVVDVSDPANPREIGFLRLSIPPIPASAPMAGILQPEPYFYPARPFRFPVQPGRMVQRGDTLFLAAGFGIYLIDVTEPTSPRLRSEVPAWTGYAADLDLEDDTLAVVGADGQRNGLWLLNIGEDGSLSERGFVSLATNVRNVAVKAVALHGERAAVAVGEHGVAVVDGIGSERVLAPRWYRVPQQSIDVDWTDDGKLVVAQTHNIGSFKNPQPPIMTDLGRGIRIIDADVSPDAESRAWTVAFLPMAEGVYAADVEGRYVYVSNTDAGFAVLDMQGGAARPTAVPSETPSSAAVTARVPATLYPYPAALVEQPISTSIRRIGSLDVAGYLYQVVVAGELVLGAGGPSGLYVMDVSDPAKPRLLGTWNGGGFTDNVAWRPPYAFIVSSEPKGNFTVLDLSDPHKPMRVSEVELPLPLPPTPIPPATAEPTPTPELGIEPQNRPFGVALVGDTALVAADFGLYAIDVSDVKNPNVVPPVGASVDMFRRIKVVGDRAFVARPYYDRGGLSIFDVIHPRQPLPLGSLQLTGTEELDVHDGHAFVISNDHNDKTPVSLNILDVSDPSAPNQVGEVAFDGKGSGIVAIDGHAFVTQTYDGEDGRLARGLHVIDTSDLSHPSKVDFFQVQNRLYGVAVQGDLAYLANEEDGLVILDVSKYTRGQSQATELPLPTDSPAPTTTPTPIPQEPDGAPPVFLPILIGGVGLIGATFLAFRRSRSRRLQRSSRRG